MRTVSLSTIWEFLRKWGLPILWLSSLPVILWGALETQGDGPFPVGGVLLFAGITLLEVGVLYLLLRPKSFRYSWGRVIFALLLFYPLVLFWGLFQDMPGYFYTHTLWLQGVLRLLIFALFLSIYFDIRERLRLKREREAQEARERSHRR